MRVILQFEDLPGETVGRVMHKRYLRILGPQGFKQDFADGVKIISPKVVEEEEPEEFAALAVD